MCVCVGVVTSAVACVCVCVYMCVCMCACVCLCVCLSVFVCGWVYAGDGALQGGQASVEAHHFYTKRLPNICIYMVDGI